MRPEQELNVSIKGNRVESYIGYVLFAYKHRISWIAMMYLDLDFAQVLHMYHCAWRCISLVAHVSNAMLDTSRD